MGADTPVDGQRGCIEVGGDGFSARPLHRSRVLIPTSLSAGVPVAANRSVHACALGLPDCGYARAWADAECVIPRAVTMWIDPPER